MRLLAAALVALLVFAGQACEAPSRPSTAPSSSPSPLPSATLADIHGVTCDRGAGIRFAAVQLAEVGAAHLDPDPAGEALRSFLASPQGAGSGSVSWTRVVEDAERVQFLGRQTNGAFVYVLFVKQGGRWTLDKDGGCSLAIALPPGSAPVSWLLDPHAPADAGSQELQLLLRGYPCDPAGPPLEHVDPAVVSVTESSVIVAVIGHDGRAERYCVGPTPIRVPLPVPLGTRSVLDGGQFPPTGPIGTYDLDCGPMPAAECREWAAEIAANAERAHSGKRVVSITIEGPDGDYSLLFDDGTGIGADIN